MKPTNKPDDPQNSTNSTSDSGAYDEQRIPFDQVMRKLANTKPPHKAAKAAPKPKKG
jgi:hypothetical protein